MLIPVLAAECPECKRRILVRKDGKLAKHLHRTDGSRKAAKICWTLYLCSGSETVAINPQA